MQQLLTHGLTLIPNYIYYILILSLLLIVKLVGFYQLLYLFILSAFNLILMYYLNSVGANLAKKIYFGVSAKNVSPAGLVYMIAPFGVWMGMSVANILLILMFDVESLKWWFVGVTLFGVLVLFLIKMSYFRDLKVNQEIRVKKNDEIRKEKWEQVFQVD